MKKTFTISGYNYLEKTVSEQPSARGKPISAGKIYLPAAWIGKKVAVILLEES